MKLPDFFAAMDQYSEHVPIDRLVELLGQLDLTRADYEHAIAFDDECYKRNILHLGEGYVALILCWRSSQASPIHDHRGSACGVRVLEGVVNEIKYDRSPAGSLSEKCRSVYPVGSVCGSYNSDIHTIANEGTEGTDLITLHVYTPPLQDYHCYSLERSIVEVCSDYETLEAMRQREALAAR